MMAWAGFWIGFGLACAGFFVGFGIEALGTKLKETFKDKNA